MDKEAGSGPLRKGQDMDYAFTAITDSDGYSIGRANVGTLGYSPIPSEGKFDTYDAARERARVMNAELGIEPEEALKIVVGTIRRF